MSEAQKLQRRSSDGYDLETRVSIIETRQDYLTDTMTNISKSLEKHIADEEKTMHTFTAIVSDMNKTVIINTEALRHLAATFMTHTISTEKLTDKLEKIDDRVDHHDVEVAKIETMGWTIGKIATLISMLVGALWALASHFIGK